MAPSPVTRHRDATRRHRPVPTPSPSRPTPASGAARRSAIDVGPVRAVQPARGCASRRRRRSRHRSSSAVLAFVACWPSSPGWRCRDGPFAATVAGVVPDGDGLAVTLSVTNEGSSAGQTTCRVTDPADRTGATGGFVLSPRIDAGRDASTFTATVDRLGTDGPPARSSAVAVTSTTPTAVGTSTTLADDLAFAHRPRGPRRRGADGPLRAARADRLQERAGRRHRGRPPVRGADPRRDPGRATRATRSSPRRPASTRRRRARRRPRGVAGSGSSIRSTARSTTPTASRSSASRSGSWSRRPARRRHPRPDPRRDVRRHRRWPGDARRAPDPRLRQGPADRLRHLDVAQRPGRRRPARRNVRKAIRIPRIDGLGGARPGLRRQRPVRRVHPAGRPVVLGRRRGRPHRRARRRDRHGMAGGPWFDVAPGPSRSASWPPRRASRRPSCS